MAARPMPFPLNFCGSTTGKDGSSFNVFFSLDISGLALKQRIKHIASETINQNQACSTRVRLGPQTGLESMFAGLRLLTWAFSFQALLQINKSTSWINKSR